MDRTELKRANEIDIEVTELEESLRIVKDLDYIDIISKGLPAVRIEVSSHRFFDEIQNKIIIEFEKEIQRVLIKLDEI